MILYHKFILQFQSLIQPGIRVLVLVTTLVTFLIFGFEYSSLSSGKGVSIQPVLKILPSNISYKSAKIGKSAVFYHKDLPLPRPGFDKSQESGKGDISKVNLPNLISLEIENIRGNISVQVEDSDSSRSGSMGSFNPIRRPKNSSLCVSMPSKKVKRKRRKMPAVTLPEMNRLLEKSRFSFPQAGIAQEYSASDLQILEAKAQILKALEIRNDPELFSPIFRNVSMFKRSYELMEKVLKVYVYTEGEKPIFWQPILKGVYSSEGWFMKQLLSSKQFIVKDPSIAHLFYVPFSSSTLRFEFFIPGDHCHDRAIEYLKNYIVVIASKHPFWNRTGGADHFFAGCHDWVPDITVPAMGSSIAAICNADLAAGFVMGRDVSLPETNIKHEENPNMGLGGKPTYKRPILAFFAGRMHGYVRPMLVQHWENKHPDMKISGPLAKKKNKTAMSYADHMKNSKFCICPRGNDVNSPRLVEAILYECVPVIISDNFVPPLFEVLNWEAFSVVVLEKDIPRLREILLSIPMKKYSALKSAVKKVQRHFIWHGQPQRYDLFHMILHSIWLNRVLRQT